METIRFYDMHGITVAGDVGELMGLLLMVHGAMR
jgi:hypothetical protein